MFSHTKISFCSRHNNYESTSNNCVKAQRSIRTERRVIIFDYNVIRGVVALARQLVLMVPGL